MNVDWRWRDLYQVVSLGVWIERDAKWWTSRLLRAKLHVDARHA